ncbi:hypothetical protein K5I29_01810 [Flavobacterium agricola]|uniref:Uncharacterized protein n=1 Tax=Flavobacterium agricola TaxID=2870839 RepID=A0ABY6LZD7_9FLAO|nr:hypothetical protein [Flavobacterium agricola]UYW01687.1 hypothetical protein K5I29_01810 [Flavobacterium agricola]
MNKKTKALVYQFISFAVIFIILRYLIENYTAVTGFWIPAIAAVASTILAPQFKALQTPNGLKLFVNWIFFKTPKEIK